jgi:hypothetical protein
LRHIRVHRLHPAFVAIASRPSFGMECANNDFDLGVASSTISEIRKKQITEC